MPRRGYQGEGAKARVPRRGYQGEGTKARVPRRGYQGEGMQMFNSTKKYNIWTFLYERVVCSGSDTSQGGSFHRYFGFLALPISNQMWDQKKLSDSLCKTHTIFSPHYLALAPPPSHHEGAPERGDAGHRLHWHDGSTPSSVVPRLCCNQMSHLHCL